MNRRSAIQAGAATFAALLTFYIACVHYTEPNEVALVWNMVSGKIELDDHAGFSLTPPWAAVARIDTRPMRVCLTSSARSFNCKLVQFEPNAYREFIAVEGFHYYWLANRLSYNSGYDDEYRGIKDILRGFSYGAKKYSFIRVLTEYEEEYRPP